MREDFCGTFRVSCEWTKLNPKFAAIGVDIEDEPLDYGRQHNLASLSADQQERIHLVKGDVRSCELPSVDLACALNFSYFCFKNRQMLRSYFANVYQSLNPNGIFVMDCFGGSQCYEANEEETEYEDEGFSYFWDQDNFDPVTNHSQFYIHFQRHGEKKRERIFSYDWRLWSLPELRDILEEVGFRNVTVYWEGTDEDGEGDGEFKPVDGGEECESWVAYLVADR